MVMRHKPTRPDDFMEEIYPLFFWQECKLCKREFRRERMWKARIISGIGEWHDMLMCKRCCPTVVFALAAMQDEQQQHMPGYQPRPVEPPKAPPAPPRER